MAIPRSTIVPPSFNPFIDGLLSGGGWIGDTIVWGVADNPVEGYFWIDGTASAAVINGIIETIDSVIAVDLQYGGWWTSFLGPPLDITITFTDPETYALLGASPNSDGAVAYPFTPAGDAILATLGYTRMLWPQPEGDVGLNITQQENFSIATPGSFGWFMGLFLGAAALGLKAPQTTGPVGFPTYESLGLNDFDTPLWTVMASISTLNGVYPSTLMPGDILALQYIYGADTTTNAGDTTHILANDGLIRTIYDAGGTDTLDASGLGVGASIEIQPLGYSLVGATSIVAIALGVTIENAIGGAGGDHIRGNDANNTLHGNGGDDVLIGEQGADRMEGGAGDDRFALGVAPDGVDQIFGGVQGADAGFDTLDYSGAQAGVIVQFLGWSTTSGGAVLTTFSGIEAAVGTIFNDALIGNAANNRLEGSAGADWLVGGGGDDWFVQGIEESGGDRLFGGVSGADAGFDTIDYSGAHASVTVQLNGWSTGGGITLATFTGIEAAIGTAFDDALIGSAASNRITGGQGSDWLVGQGGDDWFVQGTGSGVDRLFGDAGIDTIDYSGAGAGVTVQLTGWSTLSGGTLLSTFTGIENAVGTAFSDALIGNASDNRIAGGIGADWLVGQGGADWFVQTNDTTSIDRLFGDAGTDTIDYSTASAGVVVQLSGYAATSGGGSITLATFTGIEDAVGTVFNDALIGNASDNRLTGGTGGDWLVGGGGADTFVYQSVSDGAGDSVRDFVQGADRIDLAAIDAIAGGADDPFTFATERHAGVLGEAVVANFGGSSVVSLYLDGDNIADMTLQVVHGQGVAMNAGDFFL